MSSYTKNLATPSDIQEHLGLLHGLAMDCERVVELGFRTGVSASAFLAAGAKLTSYDIDKAGCRPHVQALAAEYPSTFTWKHGDSRKVFPYPHDLLFIDSAHTYECTLAELNLWVPYCKNWVILHDTVSFGHKDRAPGSGPGIRPAIEETLADQDWHDEVAAEWYLHLDLPNCNGLVVYQRDDTAMEAQRALEKANR